MYDKIGLKRRKKPGMNFNDRKTRKRIAVIIILVIIAMVATTVLPYMMGMG